VSNPNKAEAGARHELVSTSVGTARLDWFPAQGQPRAVALLGHGTATGVEAADLQAQEFRHLHTDRRLPPVAPLLAPRDLVALAHVRVSSAAEHNLAPRRFR